MKLHATKLANSLVKLCPDKLEAFATPMKVPMVKENVPKFKGLTTVDHPYQNYVAQPIVQLPPPMSTLNKAPKPLKQNLPTPYNQYSPPDNPNLPHSINRSAFVQGNMPGKLTTSHYQADPMPPFVPPQRYLDPPAVNTTNVRMGNSEMFGFTANRGPLFRTSQLNALNATYSNSENPNFILDAPMNENAYYNVRKPSPLQTASTVPMNQLQQQLRCTLCNAFKKEGFKDCPCRQTTHVSLK